VLLPDVTLHLDRRLSYITCLSRILAQLKSWSLKTTRPTFSCAIVLDLHLPKHDGAAVLKAIRLEPTLAHIQVVALTSFSSPKEETEVRTLGINLYRSKPTDLDGWIELAGEILELCRAGAEVSV
jgi:CheY-like chemotaxis protein